MTDFSVLDYLSREDAATLLEALGAELPDEVRDKTTRFARRAAALLATWSIEHESDRQVPTHFRVSEDFTWSCASGHEHFVSEVMRLHVLVDKHLPPNSVVLEQEGASATEGSPSPRPRRG